MLQWLSKTIFSRLVTEMDSVNKALISLGHSDAQLGQVGLSQLKNLALSRSAQLPSLAVLVPYLEVHPNQEYVVMRIRGLVFSLSFNWPPADLKHLYGLMVDSLRPRIVWHWVSSSLLLGLNMS